MAHSSRPHPYRATSTVDTPKGPRTAAWLAGHRCLPGDVEPPPFRPILILVDYSPLQGLTHRSEPDRDLYSALANSNFKNVSAGELEALFTWARQLEPIEAGILPIRDLRTALTTRLRTQWDIHMEPSALEFRYCDLEGDAFQVPNDWTIMQLLEEYRPEWRIRQYNYIESTLLVPGTSQPFVLRLRCHKVSPGVILPWSSATPRKRSFDSLHFDSRGIINTAGYSGVYSSIHGSANLFFKHSASLFVIPLFYILLGIDVFPQLLGLHRAYSCDRFTHGAQTWRHCGWLGLAFEFEPWNLFDQEWHRARLSSFWVESPCCSCSFDLDHLGTSGNKCYSQRPWDYVTIRYLLSPNSTWCTFPDRAKFYLQCLPTLSLLIPSGPSDPIQDLYPLQQHQGVIHWRDPNIRSFEMSWSWTLFLQSVW